MVEHQETPGISDYPLTELPAQISEYQSLNVDSVTGATLTSYGVVQAVTNALEQAGADTDALSEVEINRETEPAQDMTTQVVVAGGGMSGLMAAATAAHSGAAA